jgi:hypothetical protein
MANDNQELINQVQALGPLDKQRLVHWQRSKKFYRPLPRASVGGPIEKVEVGEYKLNDYGQWHWWATEEGRAFDKLYGEGRA